MTDHWVRQEQDGSWTGVVVSDDTDDAAHVSKNFPTQEEAEAWAARVAAEAQGDMDAFASRRK